MAQDPIKFGNAQASGFDELGGAQPIAMNVYTEPTGAVRRRPGLRIHPSAPSSGLGSLTGIHRLLSGDLIAIATSGAERTIYRVAGGAAVALGGGVPPAGLRGTERPSFAETEMLLVIAGGDAMQKIELATFASSRLGGSPPVASHVIANSQRLLANDLTVDRTKVRYSSTAQGTTTYAGHEQWLVGAGTAGFFTAEARPDPIVALGENTNEVFIFGGETTEVYGPDPTLRYQRIAAQEVGCSAPASVIKADDAYFWRDQQKRFVMSNGRSFEPISGDIQATLDAIDDDSCFGYRVRVGALDAVAWTFPVTGQTFAYQRGVGWAQWAGFDGNWAPLIVTALTGTDTVTTSTGRVAQFHAGTTTDLGQPIRAYVLSGFENHGTDAFKDCERVRLALRRGQTASTSGDEGSLWYRDSLSGGWEYAGPVDLGGSGDTNIVLDFPSLGSYRRRQWKFEFSGDTELVLLSATETYTITQD